MAADSLMRRLQRHGKVGDILRISQVAKGDGGVSLKIFLLSDIVVHERLYVFLEEAIRHLEHFQKTELFGDAFEEWIFGQFVFQSEFIARARLLADITAVNVNSDLFAQVMGNTTGNIGWSAFLRPPIIKRDASARIELERCVDCARWASIHTGGAVLGAMNL